MDRGLGDRLAEAFGVSPIAWRRVTTGYTPAERWVVSFDDGASAFVKSATDSFAESLRREYHAYQFLPAQVAPRLLGWSDDGERPVLILEDLSDGIWPPPWDAYRVDAVLNLLDEIAALAPPPGLPTARAVLDEQDTGGWDGIGRSPETFLSLGVATMDWLEGALPALIDAEASAPLDGRAFIHLDVRSDNICFLSNRAVLVDWSFSAIGNPRLDLAAWLPSLHMEGGPEPGSVMSDEPQLAAFISGYWASHAGLPADTPSLPRVRALQLAQLRTALPWACELLGLPLPTSGLR